MEESQSAAEGIGFRHVTLVYVAALSLIALLSVGTHLIADTIIHREEETAKVVNVSGRQRMLSQRIAELSLELSLPGEATARSELLERLRAATQLMADSHQALTHGSAAFGISAEHSPAVHDIYYGDVYHLDQQVESYLAMATAYLNLPQGARAGGPELQGLLAAAHQPILAALDAAVKQYERDSEESIHRLRRVMLAMMLAMLSALAAEAFFIFRPLFARLRKSQHNLLEAARTDPLTGCMNRRHILEVAGREFARTRRYRSPLTVLMLDIDRFKAINDTWGHAAGDEAIMSFTREILAGIRSCDMFGRVGGEEFVVILPETALEQGVAVAEKLRSRIAAQPVVHAGKEFSMTVSIGAAAARPEDTAFFETMGRADRRLYEAKAAGRNRVVAE